MHDTRRGWCGLESYSRRGGTSPGPMYLPGRGPANYRGAGMTERKPQGMSFTSWIDQQIADAERRGVFDNLPGAGKPLELKRDADADYGQAWMRDYARREGVSPEEFLPTPLRVRRKIEQLAAAVGEMASEHSRPSGRSGLHVGRRSAVDRGEATCRWPGRAPPSI